MQPLKSPAEDQRKRNRLALVAGIVAVVTSVFLASRLGSPGQPGTTSLPPATLHQTPPNLAPGSFVTLNTLVRANSPQGEVIIHAGDRRKLIAIKGSTCYVEYAGQSVPIPSSAIDFSQP